MYCCVITNRKYQVASIDICKWKQCVALNQRKVKSFRIQIAKFKIQNSSCIYVFRQLDTEQIHSTEFDKYCLISTNWVSYVLMFFLYTELHVKLIVPIMSQIFCYYNFKCNQSNVFLLCIPLLNCILKDRPRHVYTIITWLFLVIVYVSVDIDISV